MVTFPLRPVTFPGYVFTSNIGDDTGIQLALSKDTRVGIDEFIASGKAGKPNRTTHHSMPYSGISHFDRHLIFHLQPIRAALEFHWLLSFVVVQLFGFTAGPGTFAKFHCRNCIPSFSDEASLMSLESRQNYSNWHMSLFLVI